MRLAYYHLVFRIYQLGRKLGLKRFDPFTISCYLGVPMAAYIIALNGVFSLNLFDSSEYYRFVLLALIVIGCNYFIIRQKGMEDLRAVVSVYLQKNKAKTIGLDLIAIVYYALSFLLLYLGRHDVI